MLYYCFYIITIKNFWERNRAVKQKGANNQGHRGQHNIGGKDINHVPALEQTLLPEKKCLASIFSFFDDFVQKIKSGLNVLTCFRIYCVQNPTYRFKTLKII